MRPLRPVIPSAVLAVAAASALLVPASLRAQGAPEGELCRQVVGDDARHPDARGRAQTLAQAGGTSAFFQGCLLLADDDYGKAADALERAVGANDQSAEAHYWLGVAYGEQAQRANVFKQASLAGKTKRHFERAVQLDGDHLDARAGLMQFYLRAPGVMGGDKGKAREQAREIQRRNTYRGGLALASLDAGQKDFAGAAREYQQLTTQFPDSIAPWSSLAATYGQQQRWDDAFRAADGMLRAHPDAMLSQYVVGRTAAESGQQLDRGAAAMERYLAHTPRPGEPPLANAHQRLGQIEEKRGRRAEARAQYERALALDPKLKSAKDGLARVK